MFTRTFVLIFVVSVGVVIGAVSTSLFESSDPPQPDPRALAEELTRGDSGEPDSRQLTHVLESLAHVLDQEIDERRALEERLDDLQNTVSELQRQLGAGVEDGALREQAARNRETAEERLLAAGFTQLQIEVIRNRKAEMQVQWAELDDRARREGWLNTPRFYEEVGDLMTGSNSDRYNLSDADYDRYLYATGQDNRVVVGEVFPTSAAEQAGFEPGDVILSYGSDRVFSLGQLNELRSAGESGSPVVVQIVRNGEPVQITVPRGPMGIQTQSELIDPAG